MFDLFPRSQAYPLVEGLRRYGNPSIVRWLEQFKGPRVNDEYHQKRRELQMSIMRDLRQESLVATGLERPLSASSRRQKISADIWELLDLQIEMGTGNFANLSLTDIDIRENDFVVRIFGLSHPPAANSNPADDDEDGADKEISISLSADGEQLSIGKDASWRFKGEIQQEIIRQLVEASASGSWLKSINVLSKAGSNSDTIAKAFNSSPNWPTLRRYIERSNGMCRLLKIPMAVDAEVDEDRADKSPVYVDTGLKR